MNILQVNDLDLPSRRFNGYDMNLELARHNHSAKIAVLQKRGDSAQVELLTNHGAIYQQIAGRISRTFSVPGFVAPYGRRLQRMTAFRQADVVHYHLVHNNLISVGDLPRLSKSKPSVWTWHDPWTVTGHCIHPKDCTGWRTGCSPCPHLDEYFPLATDSAGKLWEKKREAYNRMDIDIVVSSEFMMDFVRNSPLGQCFSRVHKIPFGVHLEQFGQEEVCAARARFSIPNANFVIAFRCEENPYKGTDYIYKMMECIPNAENVSVLTLGAGSLPSGIRKHFHTIELGWQDDLQVLADFYSACDVFLMPSIAESFGLMAVEAMASGRPVICFEGTALPAVTFAPECGVAVPKGDVEALLAAVQHLRENPAEAWKRGELGREKAKEHYRFEDYVNRHLALYQEVADRRR